MYAAGNILFFFSSDAATANAEGHPASAAPAAQAWPAQIRFTSDFIPPAAEMNEYSDLTRAEFLRDLSPWLRIQFKEQVWDAWQG